MGQTISEDDSGYWVVTNGQSVFLHQGELPLGEAKQFNLTGKQGFLIGEFENSKVIAIAQTRDKGMSPLRPLLNLDPVLFQLIGKAVQLIEFHISHKYCGYCSTEMIHSYHEWAMLCPNNECKQRYYPQIAPSVIVAIKKENKILLANHTRHRGEIYTVLAGFVEVAEKVEDAVRREVMEECGIKIKNIRYVSSQPWPFPHSLMLAFMADYDSGEIQCDKKEILDADWYDIDNLPNLPPYGTIARRLIEDTIILCRDTTDHA
ncbi:NAD(+) diphosphatase [Thorsellia kenyensis]|uniref:NAD-capped RNA hydrolase NudC n=1 Tax=Thorsellia kenyensis TaxID=1549888 RepID=A0ABV6CG39_9GAMM